MKVSLVGWNCATGLGTMNRQIASAEWCHKWYAPLHPRLGVASSDYASGEYRVGLVNARIPDIEWLLEGTDVLLFVEVPYLASHRYLAEARARGIKVVCIPMVECFSKSLPWLHLVDQVIVPNEYARGRAQEVGLSSQCRWTDNVQVCRWGVDLTRFKHVQRNQANRFLFCNGFGGVHNRKGIGFVDMLAEMCPEVSFVVRSQTKNVIGIGRRPNVEVLGHCDSQEELYQDCDVLLAPSKFEGLGLQTMEAMASGMPTMVPDHPPMNESFPAWRIPCDSRSQIVSGNRFMEAVPRMEEFAALVRSIHGKDVSDESLAARRSAESNFDVKETLRRLGLLCWMIMDAGKL